MPPVAKRTHKLSIDKLKGIHGLSEISFENKDVTGIFGPNGVGKSTILHALAAAYNCPSGCPSARYHDFFPKLADDVWNGAQFTIEHTFWSGTTSAKGTVGYRKGTASTWWQPLISKRPIRHVVYVGIKSCLPDLESFPYHNLSRAAKTPRTTAIDDLVRTAAGRILNCVYDEIADVRTPNHPRRTYHSLTRGGPVGVSYPSVTMGAGEQRLLKLLYSVEEIKDYGLLLVDEIDLMLHGSALNGLVDHLVDRCRAKHLQVVFTSHREELLSLKDKINIRHLHPQGGRHHCYPNTDPDSLQRLTGNLEKSLEIFVEDALAQAVVNHVIADLGMMRHLQVYRYGSAENVFSILAALLLKGEDCAHSLFVLDGDVFPGAPARQKCINESFVGNDARAQQIRADIPNFIKDLVLPADMKPEQKLHGLICAQDIAQMTVAEAELANIAAAIINPADTHQYVGDILLRLGGDREAVLGRIIALAAKHKTEWDEYTAPVKTWLETQKMRLNLQ